MNIQARVGCVMLMPASSTVPLLPFKSHEAGRCQVHLCSVLCIPLHCARSEKFTDESCHRGHGLSTCLSHGSCHRPQAGLQRTDSWHCDQQAARMVRVPSQDRHAHARRCRPVQLRTRACHCCLRRGVSLRDCRGPSALALRPDLERIRCEGTSCAARPCANG